MPQAGYTDAHLMSDYRLLEDLTQAKEAAARQSAVEPRLGAQTLQQLPRYLRELVAAAAQDQVKLQLMPPGAPLITLQSRGPWHCALSASHGTLCGRLLCILCGPCKTSGTRAGMARRKCNSTRLDKKVNRIAWHVEMHFDGSDVVHTAKRVDCTTKLQEVRGPVIACSPPLNAATWAHGGGLAARRMAFKHHKSTCTCRRGVIQHRHCAGAMRSATIPAGPR